MRIFLTRIGGCDDGLTFDSGLGHQLKGRHKKCVKRVGDSILFFHHYHYIPIPLEENRYPLVQLCTSLGYYGVVSYEVAI